MQGWREFKGRSTNMLGLEQEKASGTLGRGDVWDRTWAWVSLDGRESSSN